MHPDTFVNVSYLIFFITHFFKFIIIYEIYAMSIQAPPVLPTPYLGELGSVPSA